MNKEQQGAKKANKGVEVEFKIDASLAAQVSMRGQRFKEISRRFETKLLRASSR